MIHRVSELDLIINKDLNIPYHSHSYVFGWENKK